MFDSIIASFTQTIKKNSYNVAVFMLIAFLIWQVTNHIPTQMDRLEDKIDRLEDKIDKRIDRLEDKMDSQYNELNTKMDNQYKELNTKMDKLLYYLIDNKGKK